MAQDESNDEPGLNLAMADYNDDGALRLQTGDDIDDDYGDAAVWLQTLALMVQQERSDAAVSYYGNWMFFRDYHGTRALSLSRRAKRSAAFPKTFYPRS